jgi:site-specific DNA-methyltransferase (adenine-specific)
MTTTDTTIVEGDCRSVMPGLPAWTFAAAVTDPPYEIGLMGQSWDLTGAAFQPETWSGVARLVTPGGYVAAFGGTRTWHHLAVAMERGGLAIVDTLAWLYTTGNVTSRETRLRTAFEPIILAQVPARGSLTAAVAAHGTGHLQVDACRLPYLDDDDLRLTLAKNPGREEVFTSTVYGTNRPQQRVNAAGRHPPNVAIDERVAEALGRDQRFFLCPKASRKERDAGLALELGIKRNPHTCVKPAALMEWLVRLLCPPGGRVLDPFAGSGSTGIGTLRTGVGLYAIESAAIYVQTARLRLAHWARELAASEEPQPATAATRPLQGQLTL